MGVFTVSPRPNPFTMTVSTNFSPEFSKSLSLSKIRGLDWRSAASVTFFSMLHRLVIYRVRTNIQWKEGSGLDRRQVKPRNICPFKGISFLVCSESTPGVLAFHWQSERWHASQNRAEEGGAKNLIQAQSPISPSTIQSHLTPYNTYRYCRLVLLNSKLPFLSEQGKNRAKTATFLRFNAGKKLNY